jgi:hypothetical protein
MRCAVYSMSELRVGDGHLGRVIRRGEDGPRALRVMLEMKVDYAIERERAIVGRENKVGRRSRHISLVV